MSILREADEIVNGERQQKYGSPLENWERTARLFNATLAHKLKEPITAEEAVLLMIQVKVARELHCPKRDNRIDLAGYSEVLDVIVEGRK